MSLRNRCCVLQLRLGVAAVMLGLCLAVPASATTVHGNFIGASVDFLGVQETSSFGDPEPLFGAPSVLGNSLLFTPTTFSASAIGNGGFDQTGAQLQATLMSTGASFIDEITISEFGDTDLSGSARARPEPSSACQAS